MCHFLSSELAYPTNFKSGALQKRITTSQHMQEKWRIKRQKGNGKKKKKTLKKFDGIKINTENG